MAHKNNRQIAIDKKTVQKDKKSITLTYDVRSNAVYVLRNL